jgi:hypothetical protein
MRLLEWWDALGQSSLQIAFAQRVYQTMLNYHLSIAVEQAEKKAKAKAQIVETGKTKLDWDETVLQKNYVWSLDVMEADFKVSRPEVKSAMNYLEAKGQLRNFKLSGKRSQCYYIPLRDVLKHV